MKEKICFVVQRYGTEIVGGSEARTYDVSRSTLRDCTRVFCDAVKDAGYEPMVYFTRYLAYRKYILRSITDYGFWYAEYGTRPQFVFDFDMWQYWDGGTVPGIDPAVLKTLDYTASDKVHL